MLPAQQQAQPIQDLNIEPELEQGMDIDLNVDVDPLEVIINLVNPLAIDGWAEWLHRRNWRKYPTTGDPDPAEQNGLIGEIEVMPQLELEVEGFPLPPIEDVLGEEIPYTNLLAQRSKKRKRI